MLSCVGDEILEVNGESLQGLTHQQAIQTFKVDCCSQYVLSKSVIKNCKILHRELETIDCSIQNAKLLHLI